LSNDTVDAAAAQIKGSDRIAMAALPKFVRMKSVKGETARH